jgi:hypothetical protein
VTRRLTLGLGQGVVLLPLTVDVEARNSADRENEHRRGSGRRERIARQVEVFPQLALIGPQIAVRASASQR